MPKSLFQNPDSSGYYRYLLDLTDKDDETSVRIPPNTRATVQLFVRGSIGNITIKVQRSVDGVNSVAFGSAVTATTSTVTAIQTVSSDRYLHIKNTSSADALSTGSGYADVYVQFNRE